MKITLTKKIEETVDIPVPSFWKSIFDDSYFAFIDRNTVVKLQRNDNYVCIVNGTPKEMKVFTESFAQSKSYVEVSEQEFMSVYDDAWESIRLRPQVASLNAIGLIPKESHAD